MRLIGGGVMRATIRRMAIAIALVFFATICLPSQARAATYPSPDQIYVYNSDGTYRGTLDTVSNSTIYYNQSQGALTLNNYDGGRLYLYMPDGQDRTLTIVLVGHNTIWGHDESVHAPIGFGHLDHLYITSSSGGSLTVNEALLSNEEKSATGIDAGSNLTIKGNAEVSVNVHSTARYYVTGIRALYTTNIIEHASLSVYCSGNYCAMGVGISGGGYPTQQLTITTTEEVVFDLSDIKHCTTIGVDYQKTSNVFHFENCPRITFFCSRPAHYEVDIKPQEGYVMISGTGRRIFERSDTMYRLYNHWSGEHFYTASVSERDNLVSKGWTYEGVGWYAPGYGDAVYRLYNPYAPGGDHHYTMSLEEYVDLTGVGWKGEGVSWYSDTGHSVPVYREYNPYEFAHNHNYTASVSEHNHLLSLGWRDEGIGWYGVQTMQ